MITKLSKHPENCQEKKIKSFKMICLEQKNEQIYFRDYTKDSYILTSEFLMY